MFLRSLPPYPLINAVPIWNGGSVYVLDAEKAKEREKERKREKDVYLVLNFCAWENYLTAAAIAYLY